VITRKHLATKEHTECHIHTNMAKINKEKKTHISIGKAAYTRSYK